MNTAILLIEKCPDFQCELERVDADLQEEKMKFFQKLVD